MNIEKQMHKTLIDGVWKARKLHDLAWAADQVLSFNSDNTVDQLELQGRVSSLLCIIISQADELSDFLDRGCSRANDEKKA